MREKQESGSLAHLVDLDDAALSSPEARANAATTRPASVLVATAAAAALISADRPRA
jgi:hypothetical protein